MSEFGNEVAAGSYGYNLAVSQLGQPYHLLSVEIKINSDPFILHLIRLMKVGCSSLSVSTFHFHFGYNSHTSKLDVWEQLLAVYIQGHLRGKFLTIWSLVTNWVIRLTNLHNWKYYCLICPWNTAAGAYEYNHSSLTVSTHHFQLGQLTAVANQLKDWWVASH